MYNDSAIHSIPASISLVSNFLLMGIEMITQGAAGTCICFSYYLVYTELILVWLCRKLSFRSRVECFFTYIHLDLFHSHPTRCLAIYHSGLRPLWLNCSASEFQTVLNSMTKALKVKNYFQTKLWFIMIIGGHRCINLLYDWPTR